MYQPTFVFYCLCEHLIFIVCVHCSYEHVLKKIENNSLVWSIIELFCNWRKTRREKKNTAEKKLLALICSAYTYTIEYSCTHRSTVVRHCQPTIEENCILKVREKKWVKYCPITCALLTFIWNFFLHDSRRKFDERTFAHSTNRSINQLDNDDREG